MDKIRLTPKELMISRYDAFVEEDWEYIANTSISQSVEDLKDSPKMEWLKLDVIDSYDDVVEFKAYYRIGNSIEVLHEKSNFIEVDGEWRYKDGTLYNTKILRNESCPCGSGKKFKKCCYI